MARSILAEAGNQLINDLKTAQVAAPHLSPQDHLQSAYWTACEAAALALSAPVGGARSGRLEARLRSEEARQAEALLDALYPLAVLTEPREVAQPDIHLGGVPLGDFATLGVQPTQRVYEDGTTDTTVEIDETTFDDIQVSVPGLVPDEDDEDYGLHRA